MAPPSAFTEFRLARETAEEEGSDSFSYRGVEYERGVSSNGCLVVWRRADGAYRGSYRGRRRMRNKSARKKKKSAPSKKSKSRK